ncbi:unnamed protein product, partial [Protopolystoma xenopodis]
MDEYFHLRQTLLFYSGNFSHWDPKITTPPGLYLVVLALLKPFLLFNSGSPTIIHFRGTSLFP